MQRTLTTTAALALVLTLAGCSGTGGEPAPASSATDAPAASSSSTVGSPTRSASRSPSAPSSPATSAPPSASAPTATPGTPTAAATSADPTRAGWDVDSADSPTVVVNKARPLSPQDYAPASLQPVRGVPLRTEAADALEDLLAAAAADGHELTVISGYRSHDRQRQVYAGWTARHGSAEAADRVSARPGHSEHQTGLAVDLGDAATPACDLDACFGSTAAGRWVAAHAAEHGFVVRYPAGAEPVTGFSAEPWHLRWLGAEAAAEVTAAGGVVETALGLPAAPDYPG